MLRPESRRQEEATRRGVREQREEVAEARDSLQEGSLVQHEQCPGEVSQHAIDGQCDFLFGFALEPLDSIN